VNTLLHQFFDQTASRWPDRIAVDVPPGHDRPERQTVTYDALRHRSLAVTHALARYVTGEDIVPILLPRDSDATYAAQIGVLRAGAAHACIDPAAPDDQIRQIVLDATPPVIVSDTAGQTRLIRAGLGHIPVLDVGEIFATASLDRASATPAWLTPASLAYLIYTSGTTGRPKGVMIEHRAIANLVAADVSEFGLGPNDRVAQSSSTAYDSSLEEIWLAFASGATLVVADDMTARLGPDLVPWLQRERITVWCPPPTMLRATGCANPQAALPDLKLLYVGGESLPEDVADRWSRGRRLVNGYGPTEAAVTCIRGDVWADEPVSIGKPVPGVVAHVLNEALADVSDGERGELCLSGIALARGYRNDPELTAQRFPRHPLFGRIYRTGDLVHRDGASRLLFHHGRIDAQVKLRGYRIELEAIEGRLADHEDILEAASRLQGDGPRQQLVAFVVPRNPAALPPLQDLRAFVGQTLPEYMVPARIAFIDELPRTVGGKLNRRALPEIEFTRTSDVRSEGSSDPATARVLSAFELIMQTSSAVALDDDFFTELGGDSLRAAMLISTLREHPETAALTVRDVYESRTAARLGAAANAAGSVTTADRSPDRADRVARARPGAHPVLATILQGIWIFSGLAAGSGLAFFVLFRALPLAIARFGLEATVLLLPVFWTLSLWVYSPLAVALVVVVKRVLIGRYRRVRAPVWGHFYVRHWMVQATARLVPWRRLEGTIFLNACLRALGARIGRRVHIHRGANLWQGGWDLLDIGDDVTIGEDASIQMIELEDREIVIGGVTLGHGSTIDIRACVGTDCVLEDGAMLTAHSTLARGSRVAHGECWDGIPASPAGPAPPAPAVDRPGVVLNPTLHGIVLVATRSLATFVLALPLQAAWIVAIAAGDVDTADVESWLATPSLTVQVVAAIVLAFLIATPVIVAGAALVVRALGAVRPGVISRWSVTYVRVWLTTGFVLRAGEWLSGTLMWPVWLRWAGMRIGRGCEISTIIDVVPCLITIGRDSFLADGIYLGGPRVHRGTVTLAEVVLGDNVFLGNHVVVPAGQHLAGEGLIGVCTVAGEGTETTGTSWFGHPPFALPRREVIQLDRRLTHEPSWIRYWNRVAWEVLRFALPIVPVVIAAVWVYAMTMASGLVGPVAFAVLVLPALAFGAAAASCLTALALKWILLGRVKPGQHALWSCWCSRWDFMYVAWARYAGEILNMLEGTLFLTVFLRAFGMKIGRHVVLGAGFSQVVDPDMLEFEDESTVDAQFQAHTFEDRVLKIDRVVVRRGATVGHAAVLLYGADIGAGASVGANSVVMKKERLLPGRVYVGCPTRLVTE
jgi:non-ribosomal peptide synthetase-like protein